MEKHLKILVCGDVKGQFTKLFKRIANVAKKNGPFEMLICPGQFFAASDVCDLEWEKCVSGKIEAPIPIYLLGPRREEELKFYSKVSESGGDMCKNIIYLGRKGIYNSISGLSIAYINGQEKIPGLKERLILRDEDIDSLLKQNEIDEKFKGVDILLSTIWPKNISKYTNSEFDVTDDSKCISLLASALKPRYHFAGHSEHYFERVPYRNHQVLVGQQEHVTRFISLASFGNKDNKKYLYAFNLVPMCSMTREELIKQPADTTEFPYKNISQQKDTSKKQNGSNQNFFFDQKKIDSDSKKRSSGDSSEYKKPKQPKGPPVLTAPCWFCLGSPDVEKHLVVSVGTTCYVAIAKGALTENHVLICPVNHFNSTVLLPEDTLMEIEKYKLCLGKMFRKQGLSMVVFERNFYTQHLQLQVIPIPKDKVEQAKEAFYELGEMKNVDFTELPEDKGLEEVVAPTSPYFLVEFDSGERLLHRVKSKMPLQFGREVLASYVLNMPERVNWKACKLSKEEETKVTAAFRKKFTPYDFNFS